MASPTPADMLAVISAEEAEAQALAEDRQLEFRARHQLTIDAQAHTLLEPKYAREMRAVPLGLEAGRPVVAVADPSEKRLAAIRELVTGDTKFVLVAPESLDALLKSRIFSESDGDGPVEVPPEPKLSTPAPSAPVPAQPPPAPEPAENSPAAASSPASPADVFDAVNVTQLAQQLAEAAETLLALQTQVQGIAAHFDQTRQELREQKERLAAAAAKADQDRARIKSVAASLAEDVARLDQTKADLAERLSGLVQDD
ncbi:MAG TPA: hypothetical protein VF094_05390 [Gaiellaceae bacterium]